MERREGVRGRGHGGLAEPTPRVLHRRANRQYLPIRASELWRFIASKEKVYVAFPMEDGYPHVSPMWFCVLGEKIYLRTQSYKVKARLAKAGRACCTLDEGSRYVELKGAAIWGRTRVVSEPGLAAKVEGAMNEKYRRMQWRAAEMPEWWVKERRGEARAYIEIIPEKVSSWDNARVALGGRASARPAAKSVSRGS